MASYRQIASKIASASPSHLVNCWRVKFNGSKYYITPAHVVIYNNKGALEVSRFMEWAKDCDWRIPEGYKPNEREPKLTDLAWAKVPDNDKHKADSGSFLKLSDKVIDSPTQAHLFFRQPYNEKGAWVRSELAAKDAVVYKSPESELLEAIDIGFRGLSGAVATEKGTADVVGLFIRKGKSVALKTKDVDWQLGCLESSVTPFSKQSTAEDLSPDMKLLYQLLHADIAKLSKQVAALDKEVLKRQHLEEILQVANLRRGLLLPCSKIISLLSGPSRHVSDLLVCNK